VSRPTGVFKVSNPYAQLIAGYSDTPKAVFAAVAFSLAMRLSEDDPRAAVKLLSAEWETLHRSGIVPQRPVR